MRESVRLLRPTTGSLVRVVEIRGVGLRENNDGALVFASGDGSAIVHGSVLRGVADEQILAADGGRSLLDVSISDGQADLAGLVCGGRATLMVSPIAELPPEASHWLADSEPVVLATRADGSGGELAVSPRGAAGSLGSELETDAAIRIAHQLLRRGNSLSEIQDVEGNDVLFSAAVPTTRAIVVGGGPMAEAFVAQGSLMGWQIEVVNEIADALSFCQQAQPADALLVLSHNPQVDTPVLAAGLDGAVGYIGALGSRRTQTERAERLEALGYTDRSRINGPVGLDLGSRSPAETAVAMAAEFLAVRRGRPPASLSAHDGPIHA